MRYAADLHLHSPYSKAVSPQMTIETIARFACLKGLDVIGTGDCLQGDWLTTLEGSLTPAEPGWFALAPRLSERLAANLPTNLHRALRFVLSTEVSCLTSPTERRRGIHHLVYFPSFEKAREFRSKVTRFGDLGEGRPTLALTPRELLEMVGAHGSDCHLAPAHVMNPYFSCLGVIEQRRSLEESFGELTPRLLAVETGLTATPEMCGRVSSLDGFGLFSCSDAHSPENIGRECTILETEPGYDALFAALRTGNGVRELLKFPLERTRYYRNRCSICAQTYQETHCPNDHGRLLMGSHDRLEIIADRPTSLAQGADPLTRSHLPLRHLLGDLCDTSPASKAVTRFYDQLIAALGPERFILTEAAFEALDRASTPQIARAIVAQRNPKFDFTRQAIAGPIPSSEQPTLF